MQDRVSQNVIYLRQALLKEDAAEVARVSGQLIELVGSSLKDYGDRLVRSTGRSLGVEGADLAQEAWARALRYLLSPEGESVCTDEHLIRLLWRIVHQRFLDSLERARGRGEWELDAPLAELGPGCTWADRVHDSRGPASLLWLEGGKRAELIKALFEGDAAFEEACVGKPRRRARQYRACVLFALAEFYQLEEVPCALFERYVSLFGIHTQDWEALRCVVEKPSATEEQLFAIVNERCGTRIKNRMFLSVLRYELNLLAGGGNGK